MRKKILALFLSLGIVLSPIAKADMFGGDVIVLSKILVQSIQQLVQLKKILGSTRDELNLVRDINRGINDSLNLLKIVDPNMDPGVFNGMRDVNQAISEIERIYGKASQGKNHKRLSLTDRSVAEAMVFNNNTFQHTKEIDEIASGIQDASHTVSPGGAQKLTAQSMGVLLNVENSQLRASAKSLKMQAQNMARLNQQDKERAKELQGAVADVTKALETQKEKPKFQIPRF